MKPDLPLLSVIVPVFNGEDTLATALASILNQRGAALEIIVVDDGSIDASAMVARQFGHNVICVAQTNQGPAAARNRGLELAHGAFIGFLDADDRWPNARVEHHMQLFAQAPDTEIVIGPTQTVRLAPGDGEAPVPVLPAPLIQQQLGSATCRRSVFDRVGMFDPALRIGEDKDWLQRVLAARVAIRLTRAVALEYRLRPGSLTYGAINHSHWFLIALHNHLRRSRSAPLQEAALLRQIN
jgi:glycosyltransferase involved in cell wall biosynthesis